MDPDWIDNAKAAPERSLWRSRAAEAALAASAYAGSTVQWIESWQAVRRDLFGHAWQKALPPSLSERVHLVLMGSAARQEDLLASDLDHAVMTLDEEATRTSVSHLYDFVRLLTDFLCPPCEGFVMGANPRWNGCATAWEERLALYFGHPDWAQTRYLFMVVDSSPLPECETWSVSVAGRVVNGIRQSPFLCWEMAHLGVHRSVALKGLGKVRTQRVGDAQEVNVKQGLIHPIVHAVRLLSVKAGCPELNTLARLRCLEATGVITNRQHNALSDALLFAWRMRLANSARTVLRDAPSRDTVDIHALSAEDFERLRTHLRTAKWLERFVLRRFPKPR